MAKENKQETIDIKRIIKLLWTRKKVFYITLPIVFVLSCIYILSQPRTYTTTIKLAPETETSSLNSSLGGLASTFGINLGNLQSSDAISPLLYPELMDDNSFVSDLFSIKVETKDGELKTTLYDYLDRHQKSSWTSVPIEWIMGLFKSKEDEMIVKGKKGTKEKNPYIFSKRENEIANSIRDHIGILVDKKTAVITIASIDQDPLICKTVADSVVMKLQDFITNYRTSKARHDVEYYQKLTVEAKRDYEKARQLYGSYSDANFDMMLESFKAKQNDLENDMQLKFNTYTAMSTQLQTAKAKVVERTPAFTLLKGAEVPQRPTGPKRMFFVATMLILAFLACSAYILKDEILK